MAYVSKFDWRYAYVQVNFDSRQATLYICFSTGCALRARSTGCLFFIFIIYSYIGGMEAKLKETKLKLENSGEIRHTLVLWNQIISGIFRVQAWETKIK